MAVRKHLWPLLAISLAALPPACAGRTGPDHMPVRPVRIARQPASGPLANPAHRAPLPGPGPAPSSQADVLIGQWPERGPRVSLDEQRAPIRSVLDRLARASRLNFVVADEVHGEVTCSVTDVPLTEALIGVLAAKGLVAIREGNVVYIEGRAALGASKR